MTKAFECNRELIVDKSADQVWEWLVNIRNTMTANQFHESIDCDDSAVRNARAGSEIPILHQFGGHQFYRIARITKLEDYEIAWGERLPEGAGYEDPFPHSEGWKVESLGANQCRVRNRLRGRFMLPIGELIGEQAWDAAIPVILDNDLQGVALATGAIEARREIPMPQASAAMLRLTHARVIDGTPIHEFMNQSANFLRHPS